MPKSRAQLLARKAPKLAVKKQIKTGAKLKSRTLALSKKLVIDRGSTLTLPPTVPVSPATTPAPKPRVLGADLVVADDNPIAFMFPTQ